MKKIKKTQKNKSNKAVSFVEQLKAEMAAFFEINDELAFASQEIFEHFDIHDKKINLIAEGLLQELRHEGRIAQHKNGKFQFKISAPQVGKVEHVNKNYGFVVTDGEDQDVWVDADDLRGAFDGDLVEYTLFSDFKAKRRREGRVEKILERARPEMVGTLDLWPHYGIVTPDVRRVYDDIFVNENKLMGATTGDKVRVKITQWPSRLKKLEGEVIEVLGKAGENNAEMHAILAEFGLPYKFTEELEAEANAISDVISEQEIARRRDMRNILTFTIDPADAKDFDDALSVQFLDNGHVEVGVHIADVSHYVTPDSLLEKEAYTRATSVYLVDRTVPMLPERLSNNLCSLRPHEDKLTFSAIFELNHEAKIIKEWFGRTIIHSAHRFTYENAQEVLDNAENENDKFSKALFTINRLAYKLKNERFKNGAINFETNEVKFQLGDNGVPLGIYQKVRGDSHKLIEEFMLLANKRVAEFVFAKSPKGQENTMVYRIHEEPNIDKLQQFAAFATRLGYPIKVNNEKQAAGALNQLMANLQGKPEQNVLEQLAIRTMAKARYSTEDVGHFGLAFRRYSHFTSPIRRYPDMMAHRLLQHYLDERSSPDRGWYDAACKQSSEREKMASDAERASIKYKQVEFMSLMEAGRVWEGIITGVSDFGIFVEITETASEGLIRMNDLNDDYYDYDKENYRLVGQRTHKSYTFGDAVKVRVKNTDLARRSMDLVLAEAKSPRNIAATKNERNRQRNMGKKKGKRR